MFEAHVLPHRISGIPASTLTSEDIRRYRADRSKEGAKDTTCNREIAYIRAALNRALKEGRLSVLPYFPVTKEDNARQGFINEDEFMILLGEMFGNELRSGSVDSYIQKSQVPDDHPGQRKQTELRIAQERYELRHGKQQDNKCPSFGR